MWEERLPGADVTESSVKRQLVDIDTSEPVWERFFTVAPLVLIGTIGEDGKLDIAPKHMVTPMGWQNYFGFVCTPSHTTCSNIERSGEFTVSYPKPSQVLYTSLAASPRVNGAKPSHPELLDWLAVEFRDGGWNVKELVRMLVMSGAYRQTSIPAAALMTTTAWFCHLRTGVRS